MDKAQLRQLKDEISIALQPVLKRHGLESAYQSRMLCDKNGKLVFAFETSTKESAAIRLSQMRFLLGDECRNLDIRQPFFISGEIHVLVDVNTRRSECPWVVENEHGNRTFISTTVLRDSLLAAELKQYTRSTVATAKQAADKYATWG